MDVQDRYVKVIGWFLFIALGLLWAFTKPNLIKKAQDVKILTERGWIPYENPTDVRWGSDWVTFTAEGQRFTYRNVSFSISESLNGRP